jgi:hypothetical protein
MMAVEAARSEGQAGTLALAEEEEEEEALAAQGEAHDPLLYEQVKAFCCRKAQVVRGW